MLYGTLSYGWEESLGIDGKGYGYGAFYNYNGIHPKTIYLASEFECVIKLEAITIEMAIEAWHS